MKIERRTRRMYLVAEQDGVDHPEWVEKYEGQMLLGIAIQELIDQVDWGTTQVVLDESLKGKEKDIRESEPSFVKILFAPHQNLLNIIKTG